MLCVVGVSLETSKGFKTNGRGFAGIISLVWPGQYTVAVSPVGREGIYNALSSIPTFSAMLIAGGFSGYLLDEYFTTAQKEGDRQRR